MAVVRKAEDWAGGGTYDTIGPRGTYGTVEAGGIGVVVLEAGARRRRAGLEVSFLWLWLARWRAGRVEALTPSLNLRFATKPDFWEVGTM